jgi:hypothetical protein
MKTLKIKIEAEERSDLVAALEDVLKLVRVGQTALCDKNGFAEAFFEITDSSARKQSEKKPSRKGKRNA